MLHALKLGEHVLSSVVVTICALILLMRGPDAVFTPFFRNWPSMYREGLIDGAEWRAHRFEWL